MTVCTVVGTVLFGFFFYSSEGRVSVCISLLLPFSPVFMDTFSLDCLPLLPLDLETMRFFEDIFTVSSSSLPSSSVSSFFFFYVLSSFLPSVLGLGLYLFLFILIARKLIFFHSNSLFNSFLPVMSTLHLPVLISLDLTSSILLILMLYVFWMVSFT